ncbi:toprim domain-containing protein [Bacillus carboniphilus]|uniref:Toprim domain-containing protein n=1 Tax=Bacillus carboniphilus TaxID=86663 RepID=A0ABY9JSF1_9BACI|nr:toprim domain-containing protein [Bacillus carboniphilus]WLR41340.1 toprim domain-containing protein [Bacillus carboniphilus]
MSVIEVDKVIIVEGKTDKKKVEMVINEPIEVICTNGTLSIAKLDQLIEELANRDVYIFVDSDYSGDKIRAHFKKEFPEAMHLYVDKSYREVATAPERHVATVLAQANFEVQSQYLSSIKNSDFY